MNWILGFFEDSFEYCNKRYVDEIKKSFLKDLNNSNEIKEIIDFWSFNDILPSLFLENECAREILKIECFDFIINGFVEKGYYSSKYNIVFLKKLHIEEINNLNCCNDNSSLISDVIEFNDEYSGFKDIIDDAVIVVISSIDGKPKGKYEISLLDFLKKYELITDYEEIQCNKLVKDFKKNRSKINRNIVRYIKKDADFKYELCERIFSPISENYSKEETEFIFSYITNSKYSMSLLRFLYTYNFTNNILEQNMQYDFLDKTFVTVSIFKIVEFLFCKLINKNWSRYTIYFDNNRGNKKIYLSDEGLMLKEMEQIFICDVPEIQSFINKKIKYATPLKEIISRFRAKTRNGFLHKDAIMDKNQLNISVDDTLNSIALLILFFEYPIK